MGMKDWYDSMLASGLSPDPVSQFYGNNLVKGSAYLMMFLVADIWMEGSVWR